MSTAPSLALRSLLTGVLRETGLSSPLQRISGATSPVRALAVAAAAKRLADDTILLVVPTDADIESTVGDISFLPVGARRLRDDGGRAAGAAVSVDAGRSVSRLPAALEGRLRPRAGVACAGERQRARRRRVGGGPAARSFPIRRRSCCRRARSSLASTSIRTSSRTRSCSAATSRPIRSMRTASSRGAAASSTCSRPAKSCRSASSSSATRSNRFAASIPARSDRSKPSIASASSQYANPAIVNGV